MRPVYLQRGAKLVAQREDVGRHNAVDKIVGWALLEGRLPLSEYVLMMRGRGGFEIVQKEGWQACRWLLPYRRLRAWRCGLRGSFGLPWSDF